MNVKRMIPGKAWNSSCFFQLNLFILLLLGCTVFSFSCKNRKTQKDLAGKKGTIVVPAKEKRKYADGRPVAKYRLEAVDSGIIIKYGQGPDSCDNNGARNCWIWEHDSTYYMHYDGIGEKGAFICQAISPDLKNWTLKGPVLKRGKPGRIDAGAVLYGTVFYDEKSWHMFYLGTPTANPAPDFFPEFPFYLLKAASASAAGAWKKQYKVTPFRSHPGSYYSRHTGPGQIVKYNNEYLMFFSSSTLYPLKRTLGIARTTNLDSSWKTDEKPALPLEEQIENFSIYYEKENDTWFLFTNHYGIRNNFEYTDAIWVYWTKNLAQWNPAHKAVVMDSINCTWSPHLVGSPSVVRFENRLALFYDGSESPALPQGQQSYSKRSIGLAWLHLPLIPPIE